MNDDGYEMDENEKKCQPLYLLDQATYRHVKAQAQSRFTHAQCALASSELRANVKSRRIGATE